MINLIELSNHAPQTTLTDTHKLYGGNNPGLAAVKIETDCFYAVISIQGAQLLEFRGKDQKNLLWLSPKASFKQGKAIRGGIPVCAPWFGPHPHDSSKPQHGFARNLDWQLNELSVLSGGKYKLQFELPWTPDLEALYPQKLSTVLTMTLGKSIELNLAIENLSTKTAEVSWALHSYLPISDLKNLKVTGCPESLIFGDEVDQSFEVVTAIQTINTEPNIIIQADGSNSAIVWNPGPEKAKLMSDMQDESYLNFVCVERGAIGTELWKLNPGERNTSQVTIEYVNNRN